MATFLSQEATPAFLMSRWPLLVPLPTWCPARAQGPHVLSPAQRGLLLEAGPKTSLLSGTDAWGPGAIRLGQENVFNPEKLNPVPGILARASEARRTLPPFK